MNPVGRTVHHDRAGPYDSAEGWLACRLSSPYTAPSSLREMIPGNHRERIPGRKGTTKMIRSNRSIRRFCTLLVAMFAFAAVVPAVASAQSINPTDEEYRQGVLGVAASGGPGDPAAESGTISELPFTGLDVAAIAAIGAGLVGAGFVVRRAARTADDPRLS